VAIFRCPVTITYPGGGSPGVNIWHVDTGSLGAGPQIDQIMGNVQDFYTAIRTLLGQNTVLAFDGVAVDVATGLEVQATAWSVTGTLNTAYLPQATAIVVGWRTGTTDRSGIGRTFLGPFHLGSLDADGSIAAASLSTLRAAVAALVAANQGEGDQDGSGLVVWSRRTQSARLITAGRIRDTFAVLRSRRD